MGHLATAGALSFYLCLSVQSPDQDDAPPSPPFDSLESWLQVAIGYRLEVRSISLPHELESRARLPKDLLEASRALEPSVRESWNHPDEGTDPLLAEAVFQDMWRMRTQPQEEGDLSLFHEREIIVEQFDGSILQEVHDQEDGFRISWLVLEEGSIRCLGRDLMILEEEPGVRFYSIADLVQPIPMGPQGAASWSWESHTKSTWVLEPPAPSDSRVRLAFAMDRDASWPTWSAWIKPTGTTILSVYFPSEPAASNESSPRTPQSVLGLERVYRFWFDEHGLRNASAMRIEETWMLASHTDLALEVPSNTRLIDPRGESPRILSQGKFEEWPAWIRRHVRME